MREPSGSFVEPSSILVGMLWKSKKQWSFVRS